jgi:WD repeat-containing protein 21A
MPVELPGFYFDENRNRYFPKSSQAKAELLNPPTPEITAGIDSDAERSHSGDVQPEKGSRRPKRQHTPWRFQQLRLTSSSYTEIMRESQYVDELS